MLQPAFSDAIAAASDELSIAIADRPDQVIEAQRLRYRVYCEERGFEPGEGGLEQDVFDGHSRHVLVTSRATGRTLGTVRIVLPTLAPPSYAPTLKDTLPMSRVVEDWVVNPLPEFTTGEISRFALTRDRAGVSPAAAALMRLCLMRGIVEISGQHRLTTWCAIMERSLLRLLRATAIHFEPVGDVVDFHGWRQPAVGSIDTVLNRIRREQPVVWSFLTADGALWSNPAERIVATA